MKKLTGCLRRIFARCLFVIGILVLAACGGGGGGSGGGGASAFTVSGTAMKGPIQFARTELFSVANDGTLSSLQTGTTSIHGTFNLGTLSPSPTGHYLIEVRGDLQNAQYQDEIQQTQTMKAEDRLQAIFHGDACTTREVVVTPLTTMAARRVLALVAQGVQLATAVDTVNRDVSRQFGVADVVCTIAIDPADADSSDLGDREQRFYGIVMGGLALMAGQAGVMTIDLAEAFAQDAEDGELDGFNSDEDIHVPKNIGGDPFTLHELGGLAEWKQQADAFTGHGNNKTNLSPSTIIETPQALGSMSESDLRVSTTTLPAWIEGQPGTAVLAAAGGTSPYMWDGIPPAPWNLNAEGNITGTAPLLDGGSTAFISPPFEVTVFDNASDSAQATFRIMVVKAPPTINILQSNVTAQEGSAFSNVIAEASGGVPGYRYRKSTGSPFPPSGTAITTESDEGVLSGTPAAGTAGTYPLEVCVIDSVGGSDCGALTLTVQPPDDDEPPNGGGVSDFDGIYTGQYTGCRPTSGTPSGACPGGVFYSGNMDITVENGQVSGTGSGGETLTGTITSSGGSFSGDWNNNIGTPSFPVTAGKWGESLVSGANADTTESVAMGVDDS